MKYLLLLALVSVVWWVWSKRRANLGERVSERPAERMVVCARCGLHLPESDALTDGDVRFCCEAHRTAGAPRRADD